MSSTQMIQSLRRHILIACATLALVAGSTIAASAQLASSAWPKYMQGTASRGASSNSPSSISTLANEVTISHTSDTSPIIGPNNEIYYAYSSSGSSTTTVAAYHISGSSLVFDWSVSVRGIVTSSSPAADSNGYLYIGTNDSGLGYVERIATSSPHTVTEVAVQGGSSTPYGNAGQASANIGSDGTVYVGTNSSVSGGHFGLIAVTGSTMSILWQFASQWAGGTSFPGFYGSLAVDTSQSPNVVFSVGFTHDYSRIFQGKDPAVPLWASLNGSGTVLYDLRFPDAFKYYPEQQSPALSNNNSTVYATRVNSGTGPYACSVEARSTSGTLSWSQSSGTLNDRTRQVAVDANGNVIVGGQGYVYKFNSSGTAVSGWPVSLSGDLTAATPSVDSNGNVYVAGFNTSTGTGSIYIISSSGSVLTTISGVKARHSNIALGSNFAVVGTDNGLALLQ